MNKTELGSYGEEIASEFLKKKGHGIISRNFRCKVGEIDIISFTGEYVVFTEVKLRKNADFGEAREFVTKSKQRKVIKAAQYWLMLNNCARQPRFDIIEIYAPDGAESAKKETYHIENAFGINY